MILPFRPLWALLASTALLGCALEPVPEAPPALELELVADGNVPPGTQFEGIEKGLFGGLSAVAYEDDSAEWYALSDARVRARLFRLDLRLTEENLEVVPGAVYFLTDSTGKGFAANVLDPEGLARTPWKTWLVATEPDLRDDPPEQAKILELDAKGEFLRAVDVPEKYLVDGRPPSRGLRHNLGFEALAFSPDGSALFVGAEATLVQDGPSAGFETPGFSRILRYDVAGKAFTPGDELVYPLGPFAREPGFGTSLIYGGLVELVALSSQRLLALERIFIQEVEGKGRSVTRSRIYDVELGAATDVRGIASLSTDLEWRPVSKQLLLDLDDIRDELTPGFQTLDNLEGMGLGPELEGGGRALLLVSDDNFRASQRTQFLLFRLEGCDP